jgi:nicotinate-nucleotide--dimethylbenzimidazole phosphoribosyltransferase
MDYILQDTLQSIAPPSEEMMRAARLRQDDLTKPRGSLGRLEELAIRIVGMTGEEAPSLARKLIVVMAGDHGVAREGVSAYPPEVTAQMVYNFLRGGAAISVLARHSGARLVVIDMGVDADLAPCPGLLSP